MSHRDVGMLEAEQQMWVANQKRDLLELRHRQILARVEWLNQLNTQAMLVAGSAVASLGGESLQTIDDADLKKLALDTVFVGSTAATLCFSLWVIFISSNLIMLSQMTALTGTAAEDVKTADNILADKMADVRSFYLLSLVMLLISALSMMWMNLTEINSLIATGIFLAISAHAILTLRDTSAEFKATTTFSGEDPILGHLHHAHEAITSATTAFLRATRLDSLPRLCRRRRDTGGGSGWEEGGGAEGGHGRGWARVGEDYPHSGGHDTGGGGRSAGRKGGPWVPSCGTSADSDTGGGAAAEALPRSWSAANGMALWGSSRTLYQGWMLKSRSLDGPLRSRDKPTPLDHLRSAIDALRADAATPPPPAPTRTSGVAAHPAARSAAATTSTRGNEATPPLGAGPFETPSGPLRTRRWFLLKDDTLAWFASDDDYTLQAAPRGVVALAGYMVRETHEPGPTGQRALMLLPRASLQWQQGLPIPAAFAAKSWYFRAEHPRETRRWFEALSAGIQSADEAVAAR